MKPLPLLLLRSFTFLSTEYSVCFFNDYGEKKTNDFGEGNGFSSHLQRDSQDLSTLTQLTKGPTGYVSQTRAGRLNFVSTVSTEPVWFLSTILYNNAWPSSKIG